MKTMIVIPDKKAFISFPQKGSSSFLQVVAKILTAYEQPACKEVMNEYKYKYFCLKSKYVKFPTIFLDLLLLPSRKYSKQPVILLKKTKT